MVNFYHNGLFPLSSSFIINIIVPKPLCYFALCVQPHSYTVCRYGFNDKEYHHFITYIYLFLFNIPILYCFLNPKTGLFHFLVVKSIRLWRIISLFFALRYVLLFPPGHRKTYAVGTVAFDLRDKIATLPDRARRAVETQNFLNTPIPPRSV